MAVIQETFEPWEALLGGSADSACRAVVILPARNEEASLGASLDALAAQVDLDGSPLQHESYEILLLLNNCTDQTACVAEGWKRTNLEVRLHVAERTFARKDAFIGTARRMLMDTAWRRLQGRTDVCAILSTDSDTLVRRDWVAQNLAALRAGADAVGGVIALKEGELKLLPPGARRAYLRDRRYQRLTAELEARLDPQEGDPWPRHLEHFGASLACTPEIYARAGGMPAVTSLEDVAFVGALRQIGAKLRHHPEVKVYTSSRMKGRVEVGLSGQLSIWQQMSERHEEHRVQSAAWLAHRFRTLRRLRKEAAMKGASPADYLTEIDCDRVIADSFRGEPEGEITRVNRRLAAMLATRS